MEQTQLPVALSSFFVSIHGPRRAHTLTSDPEICTKFAIPTLLYRGPCIFIHGINSAPINLPALLCLQTPGCFASPSMFSCPLLQQYHPMPRLPLHLLHHVSGHACCVWYLKVWPGMVQAQTNVWLLRSWTLAFRGCCSTGVRCEAVCVRPISLHVRSSIKLSGRVPLLSMTGERLH